MLTANDISVAAGRVIRQKMRFKALYTDEPIGLQQPTITRLSEGSIANNDAHIELSRQAAVKSMVLLKNDAGTLPIQPSMGTIAVIGPQRTYNLRSTTGQPGVACSGEQIISCTANFATEIMVGDRGSSRVNPDPAKTIGPLAGMTREATERGLTVVSGNNAAAAASADFVVLMVGLTAGDEGEEYALASGGDRASLTLPGNQDQLVRDVIDLDKPMVVVVEAGGIVNMPWLADVPAVVMAWYPGQQGGLALAQLLFGEENFSAKLPVSWAEEGDHPPFKDSPEVTTMNYFLGYRYFDQNDIEPIFPFGHGLSYSSFSYGNLQLGCPSAEKDSVIPVTVDVTNNSDVAGEEVVLVFAGFPNTTARRSEKELKGFQKVALGPRETKSVTVFIRARDLKYWQGDANGTWVVESGPVDLMVGKSGADADLTLRGQVNVL
jgi:beta-glucosidase